MKRVQCAPHVGAAAGDAILAVDGVVRGRAFFRAITDVAMRLEYANRIRALLCASHVRTAQKWQQGHEKPALAESIREFHERDSNARRHICRQFTGELRMPSMLTTNLR